MANRLTTPEWEAEIGWQLRAIRLRTQIDQVELANRAGVALNSVKHLESGKGATMTSFIKVLRALDRVEWLRTLPRSCLSARFRC
jgi:hypothetical protein